MFCKNCGAEVNEGSKFCTNCGASLMENPEPTYTAEPVNQPSPVSELLKKLVTSPAYMVAMILVAANAVFSILPKFTIGGIVTELPKELTGGAGFGGLVFGALYAIALYLIYDSVKNDKHSTAGLTIVKVISVIKIILYSLLALLMLLVTAAFTLAGNVIMNNPDFVSAVSDLANENIEISKSVFLAACIAVCVIALVCFIFAVIVEARIISTVNNAKNAVKCGTVSSKGISAFAAVILIIGAISSFLSGNLLSAAFGIAINICSAILILRYRKGMKELEK